MVGKYDHLGLSDWPFHVAPVDSSFSYLGDREVLRQDISSLLRNLSRRSGSSAHLMWAWYGSGKTHSLNYIQYLCQQSYPEHFLPIYVEFPRGIKGFGDLYREFVLRLSPDVLDDGFLEVSTNPAKSGLATRLKQELPDLSNGLRLHYMGSQEQQDIIRAWLLTDVRDVRTLRRAGLNRGISSVEDCVKTLSWLLTIIGVGTTENEPDRRILWMIDEFQRIQSCRRQSQEEINAALTSVFNRSPNSLSIILSFSGRPSSRLPGWLSRDLADRIGIEKVMLLPPLTHEDACKFVEDVLTHYRLAAESNGSTYFPFLPEAVSAIIVEVGRRTELKPRSLIHFLNAVLEEADPLLERGEIQTITAEFARNVLRDRVYLEHDEP